MSTLERLRLLAPILWTALLLTTLELGLEWRAYGRGYSTLIFGAVDQGSAVQVEEEDKNYGPIPGFPWRSEVLVPGDAANHPLIWIASSSHAQDEALPVQDLFPNRLEGLLNARGERCKVINASRAGSSMRDQIRLALSDGELWQPQRVVLYQMSNDITRCARQEAGEIPPDRELEPQADPAGAADPGGASAVRWSDKMLESTTGFALLKTNLSALVVQGRVLSPGVSEQSTESYRENVLQFVRTWRAQGAEPILCSFATSHRRRDLTQIPVETRKNIFRFNMHMSMEGWIDTVQEWNQILREVAEQEGLGFVDLAAELDGRSDLFRDFVHFTPQGHQVVAEILGEFLIAEGVER